MLIILVCIEIAFMILCALMCLKEMSDRIIEDEPLKVKGTFEELLRVAVRPQKVAKRPPKKKVTKKVKK